MQAPTIEEQYTVFGDMRYLFSSTEDEIIAEGPAGCIAGETRIYNPITGEHTPVKELCEKGMAPIVQTLIGAIQAEVPFLKGVRNLYRVTLASGRQVVATDNHLFLTPDGWQFLSACSSGASILISAPCPQQTTEASGPLVSQQDALRLSRIPLSSQEHYFACSRHDDAPPLSARDSDQVFLPSQGGVLAHSRDGLCRDDRASLSGYSRQYPQSDHHARMCYFPSPDDRACMQSHAQSGTFLPVGVLSQSDEQFLKEKYPLSPIVQSQLDDDNMFHHVRLSEEYHSVSSTSGLSDKKYQVPQQSTVYSSFDDTTQLLHPSALALDVCTLSSVSSNTDLLDSNLYYSTQWDTVSSVEFVRKDEYFDLHVPLAEHYLAEGIWHHNTGKSRGNLEYLNYWATEYPGCRLLMLRKTRRSLTESGMVTFEQKVLHPAQRVRFKSSMQQYQYPNGSILAVGGLDKPEKILSSEWDIIYPMEAQELTEGEWEICSMRVRNGKLPVQQMIGDCNPDRATHWIKQRAQAGKLRLLHTRHEDNPMLFHRDGTMTREGERYLARLDQLTGVRYSRYRLGLWVSAEGMVYEDSWNPSYNLVNQDKIPDEWPRYLAIDFGFIHPFVCLWAAQDPDGRLIVYRQLYMTKRLVEDHARDIKRLSRWGEKGGDPLPRAIICDHDAEDRATLERHLGLFTIPAIKNVSAGIQAVSARLRVQGDGKPRVMIMRDSLVERDREQADAKKPTCLQEEPESYIWDTRQGMKKGEAPVKDEDDGLDSLRYLISYFDLRPSEVRYSKRIF